MTNRKSNSTNYIACLQQSIDFIEDNLKVGVALSACARAAGFSTYHYCRVFEAYIGVSVMSYVRRRRLSGGLGELDAGKRIIDIAMDCGYSSERAFRRAFKKEYGVSPGQYRKSGGSAAISPRPVLAALMPNHRVGGIVMETKIVRKPAFKVVGLALNTTSLRDENHTAVPRFWQEYLAQDRRQELLEHIRPTGEAELGLCFPGALGTEKFTYVIGREVADFGDVPKRYFKGEVPAATYAVFTTPPTHRGNGFVKSIQDTWDYIFKDWFPASGYRFDGAARVDFELYDERSAGDEGIQIDIYVPVTRRK